MQNLKLLLGLADMLTAVAITLLLAAEFSFGLFGGIAVYMLVLNFMRITTAITKND